MSRRAWRLCTNLSNGRARCLFDCHRRVLPTCSMPANGCAVNLNRMKATIHCMVCLNRHVLICLFNKTLARGHLVGIFHCAGRFFFVAREGFTQKSWDSTACAKPFRPCVVPQHSQPCPQNHKVTATDKIGATSNLSKTSKRGSLTLQRSLLIC